MKQLQRQTPSDLLGHLLALSNKMKTKLTIEMVREVLGNLANNVGTKGFELLIPELIFTKRYYLGTPYVKITPNETKLKLKLERITNGN